MDFRDVKKEALGATVPTDLKDAVLEEAARSRSSISAVTTLALCNYLGRDPRAYNLEPRRSRRKATEAVTSI